MKLFYKTNYTLLFLLLFASNAKAITDTLTIGQAFDWKVGDSLVYEEFEMTSSYSNQGSGYTFVTHYGKRKGFSVKAKTSLADTILYYVRWNTGIVDTLTILHLDSALFKFNYSALHIGGCGMAPTWDSPYTLNYGTQNDQSFIDSLTAIKVYYYGFESGWYLKYVEKIGLKSAYWSAKEYIGSTPGGCGVQLIYYKSDSLFWLDSVSYFHVGIQETKQAATFSLSPNPATDKLTITAERENNSPFDLYVFDVTGKCLQTMKNNSSQHTSIAIDNLPAGYYLLKLEDENHLYSTKGFVITR